MKKILRSILMVGVLSLSLVMATRAYFSSNITAQDNVITVGTLLSAIDTADDVPSGTPWMVVQDDASGTVDIGTPFTAWSNALPGDTHYYYVAIRNHGSVPFNFRFRQGEESGWQPDAPAFGSTIDDVTCPLADASDANDDLVSITEVHQFATNDCGPSGSEENGCVNLLTNPIGSGYLHQPSLAVGALTFTSPDWYYGTEGATGIVGAADRIALADESFALYRIEVTLDADTTDCYQGATYHFDLELDAKQVDDPRW